MDDPREVLRTESWQLAIPANVTATSPLLVIPTVHPRGDRRIIRCAQVALDAGFRLRFIWLGEGGVVDANAAVEEVLLPLPQSRRQRLAMVPRVLREAERAAGDMWHIHDYYLLPGARRWRRRSKKPVLYDVHEYYADYYSARLPGPTFVQRLARLALESFQVKSAKALGGANVVTEKMAKSFREGGVKVAVSPNYPLLEHFDQVPRIAFEDRRWSVLHVGTLTPDYGTELLISLASRAHRRQLPFQFTIIARFPAGAFEADFRRQMDAAGPLPNLTLVPPMPAHHIPQLMARFGFGLSLLGPGGQNEDAVPSKNYEHLMLGLAGVVTNRRAQAAFWAKWGLSVTAVNDDPDVLLDGMMRIAEADGVGLELEKHALRAREHFTWENGVAPGLGSLLGHLWREA